MSTNPQAFRAARIVLTTALIAVTMAPFTASVRAQEAPEQTVQVTVLGFSPASLSVETGTTVVWENGNPVNFPVLDGTHEVKADDGSFASPPIAPSASWAFQFLKPGTFAYSDPRHPNLTGSIVVTGEPIVKTLQRNVDIVEPDAAVPDSWGYKPVDLIIETGTKVTWRNTGGTAHTVTSDTKDFDSGNMAAGATFTHTFDKPGAFVYHCEPHPWMTASVRVAEPGKAPPPPLPPATASGGSPDQDLDVSQPSGPRTGPQTWQAKIVEPQLSNVKTWTFIPNQLNIRPGDTVKWTNAGKAPHTVTASDKSFDSGEVASGATWSKTFASAGVFKYSCTPHPWMTAAVVVTEEPSTVGQVDLGSPGGAGPGLSAGGPLGSDPSEGQDGRTLAGSKIGDAARRAAGSLPKAVAIEVALIAMAALYVGYVARPARVRTR